MNSRRRRQRRRRAQTQVIARRAAEGWRAYQDEDERRLWLRRAREAGLR